MENDIYFDRLYKNVYEDDEDAIIVHAGKRGSVKSGDAIYTGQRLDVDEDGYCRFSLPREMWPDKLKRDLPREAVVPRVVYKPSDFMTLLSNKDLTPKGSVVVWDETGVEGDSRDFATKKNKLLKRAMETVRSRNLIIILTAPTLKSFDVGFQRSMSFFVSCEGKVQLDDGRYGKARVYQINVSEMTGKTYFYKLKQKREDGRMGNLRHYYFPYCDKQLWRPYLKLKGLFQGSLYRDYAKELNNIDELLDGELEGFDLGSMADKIAPRISEYFDAGKGKVNAAALRVGFGLKQSNAYDLKRLLEFRIRKGLIKV